MSNRIDPELLRQLLTYDPETGKLFWRYREEGGPQADRERRAFNKRWAGKEALTALSGKGYCQGTVMWHRIMAHRAAWVISFGRWPDGEIDHINRVKTDNRLANLREFSATQNQWNRPGRANARSQYKGVAWHPKNQNWVARIRIWGKRKHLGCFASERDAALAYNHAAKEAFQDFAFLNAVEAQQ